jgi:peptidyl-dipeptidase A
MKQAFRLFVLVLIAGIALSGCGKSDKAKDAQTKNPEEVKKMEVKFTALANDIEKQLAKLYTDAATSYWNASISGKDEDFAKQAEFEKKMNELLSNKDLYKQLKDFTASGLIVDEKLGRRLKLLYNAFTGYQVDTAKLNALTELATEIGKKFQTYRAQVGKKQFTDNDVENTLKTSTDNKMLQDVWTAHKNIGPVVAKDIIKLVKMRNEVAKELGFKNYHEMSLLLSDQKPEDVLKLFDELDALTTPAFKTLKGEIDAALAAKYKIKPEELMPWHYQNRYFQEAPAIYEIDLDPYYKGKDVVKLTQDYYSSIGMEIGDMVDKSDLFEKPGKNQHAFCTDIDRDNHDIRVLCNVKDNQGWMETMLHEFGHAVYFKYHDTELPWVLKTPAHTFTTEAIAMFFGRMAMNAQWMLDMGIIKPEDKPKIEATAKKIMRLQQLVFSRWSQVMYRFEKGLYENPDQDLNKLWWSLAEKYQMIKKPTDRNMPDWATKIHIATSPCYYHNYHLGELLASQLYYYMKDKLLKLPADQQASFFNNKDAGKFLVEKVFKPGALYYWDDMIEKATGEKLTAKYYAKQFVQ